MTVIQYKARMGPMKVCNVAAIYETAKAFSVFFREMHYILVHRSDGSVNQRDYKRDQEKNLSWMMRLTKDESETDEFRGEWSLKSIRRYIKSAIYMYNIMHNVEIPSRTGNIMNKNVKVRAQKQRH